MVKTGMTEGSAPTEVKRSTFNLIKLMLGVTMPYSFDLVGGRKTPPAWFPGGKEVQKKIDPSNSVFKWFKGKKFSTSNRNPGTSLNYYKNLLGSTMDVVVGSGTIAIAAANVARTAVYLSPDSVMAGLVTNTQTPVLDDWRTTWNFYSTDPFVVVPFLALMENGDSYTSSDVNNSNINTVIETGFPAQNHVCLLGDMSESRVIHDAGQKYACSVTLEITAWANLYMKHLDKKNLEEENPLVFKQGWAVVGKASQSVSYTTTAVSAYHMEPKELFQ